MKIVFLCGARDYHAMDWYRSAQKLLENLDVSVLTDLIGGEDYKILVTHNDRINKLLIIDKFLFRKQSHFGNKWRNFFKLLVLPIQVIKLIKYNNKNKGTIYHAHGMYYMFLAYIAGVEYIGTPQGSEILVRPFKSKIYRWLAKKSLKFAKSITVDSLAMSRIIKQIADKEAIIIQNGIDVESILEYTKRNPNVERTKYCSIRAMTELYRIKQIVDARNMSVKYNKIPLNFIYPFYEINYKNNVMSTSKEFDNDLGRIDRISMYKLLFETKVVFSIPISDSSPRSVYEAIFCGCIVVIEKNKYYDMLPKCMQERIILVDVNKELWFEKAIAASNEMLSSSFSPTKEALILFDQKKTFSILSQLYKNQNEK